jgi:RHS repeat-associated protein
LIEVKRKDKTYPHKHNQLGHLIFASAQASTYDVLGAPLNIHSPHFQENIVGRDPLHQLLHRTVEDPVGKFECHYHYDELSQLIEETAPYPHTYVNDPLYNQVVKDGFLQSHNALNQLLKSSQSYYTYDLNGNRLSDKSRSYEYDALDRLIRIRQQDMHVSYTYDENNRRLSKTVTQQDQSETTYYFYSGTQELGTYKDGQMIELKIPGEKSAVAFEIQQTTYLPTYDHLGNVCCLHSPPGELVETYRHSAFGEEQIFDADNHPSDSINPWRYQGQRHDPESNLIYFGLRFYDPSTAKWLTPDPIGQEGGPNLYAYVLNNPLRYFDRLGLSPEEDTWMDYEIDRLSHYFLERDREQGIKRKDVAHALCGSCHGSLDFALGTLHDWHTFFAHLGAGELDFEERTQILGEIQRSQANQMARVEGWVAHQFSVDPSDPVYQSFRSSTRIGLEVGTLVAGGYGAVQGITKVTRITRLPSAIAKTSFQTVIKGSRNRFTPNFHASGAHTVFRKDPIMGNITHYETFRLQTNPFDPKPWESVLRYDGLSDVESRHYNKILKRYIDTPHVHDPLCPGGIRPAREWEIPK